MTTPPRAYVSLCVSCLSAALVCIAPAATGDAPIGPTATVTSNVALRDPFWPVGYVHTNTAVAQAAPTNVETGRAARSDGEPRIAPPPPPVQTVTYKWDEAQKRIPIKGRYWDSTAKRYMVSIGGKWHAQGEFVTVLHEGLRYRWRVTELTKDNVHLSKVDAVPSSKGDK